MSEPSNYGPAVHHTDTHLHFYGYELQIPESRLQNWYPSIFSDPNDPSIRIPTNQHYIMYRKALAMSDNATAARILKAATPTEAQKLGREVKNYDSKIWKEMVDQVAEDGNYLKFSQIEECRSVLLGTGEKVLVEASPVDRNWVIGFRGDEAEGREEEWGRNILGKALMRERERLREEDNEKERGTFD